MKQLSIVTITGEDETGKSSLIDKDNIFINELQTIANTLNTIKKLRCTKELTLTPFLEKHGLDYNNGEVSLDGMIASAISAINIIKVKSGIKDT